MNLEQKAQMSLEQSYNDLKGEVEALVQEVSLALSENAEIQALYKGWRIMFSPLLSKPKVMFIGINPGAGQPGVIDLEHSDKERLEYLDWDYDLARETKNIFSSLDSSHLLTNESIKTNFFYISTTAEGDLYKITDYLGRSKNGQDNLLGDRVFSKAYEWTKRIIELVQPSIIVCEGIGTFKNVADLFPIKDEYSWQNECGLIRIEKQNLTIVGYSRTFSRVRNKAAFCSLLKPVLQEIA